MHIIKRPLSILLSLLLIISVFTIIPITTASAETVQVFARKWVQAENVTGDYFSFTDLYQNFIICRGAPSFDENNFNIDDTTNVYNRTGDISLGGGNEIRLNSWNDGSGHLNWYWSNNSSAQGDGKIYLSTNGDNVNFNTDDVTWYAYTWETFGADHVEAVAADCTNAGNIEYYTAGSRYFEPISGTTDGHQNVNQITEADTVIAAAGHTLTHYPAVAATPTTDGNIEYWQCSVCNKYFSDAQGTNEITQAQTVIPFTGVAQIGDTKYTTLAAAAEAANGEQAIKVLADGQSYQLSVGESFKLALDTVYTPTFTSANAEYYVTYTTETNWYNVYLARYAVKAVVPNYGTYYFTEAQMNSGHWLYNVYNGTTITLLTDMTYTKSVSYGITSQKSFTLDMGGHTLTFAAPAAETHSIYSRSNNTITVRNGKIKFTTDDGFWMKGGTLNVENGATLEATNGYSPIIMTHDGVVNIKPGAEVLSENSYAIATNGTGGNGGYTINITGGEITATNAPAIYHANTGTLNISGEAEITGTDALYIKSGTTNITGGTFTATGTYAAYTHNPNGTNPTGDAIVVESTSGYAAIDSISITDGMFITTDEGTKAVATYAYGSGQEEQTGFISGGLFSTPVAEAHCAEGYKPVENGDGTYGVTEKLFAGHSLSLKGDIAANFYLNLTAEQANNTTVSFEWDDHTLEDVPVVYDEYYQLYKVSCPVYAAYMTSDITATVTINGEVQDETDVYSVERYARVILEDEEYITAYKQEESEEKYNKLAALVKAMLNYGDAAQTYFNINTDAPANRSLSTDDKTVPAVTYEDINKPYNSQTTNLPAGVEFKSVTLSLRSETTLSLYFKSDATLSFSCSGEGLTVQTDQVGVYQVARIRGFKAKELGEYITLTVTAGENCGTVSYCPMTYCYNILKKGTSEENLPEVVTALYWYWQKAVTYFTNN